MLIVNNDNFKNEVLESNSLVVVDFYADWCGPCQMLKPLLEEISSERSDVKIVKVNVDSARELAVEYSIFSIPTVLFFKGGKQIDKFVGYIGKDAINKLIDKNL